MVRTRFTKSSCVIPCEPLSIMYSFDLCTCSFLCFFGIDVGSWTFLAQGRRVSAAGKHGRREIEREPAESSLPKHKFQHDTWCERSTTSHANQVCSIIRRLLHQFFKLKNNICSRQRYEHMCCRQMFCRDVHPTSRMVLV